jgi:DNA polymerase III delta prime subunit
VEETPRNTLFIFSSNSKNEVLQTIVSRSQIIYLCKKRNVSFKEKSLEGLPTDVKELVKYLK